MKKNRDLTLLEVSNKIFKERREFSSVSTFEYRCSNQGINDTYLILITINDSDFTRNPKGVLDLLHLKIIKRRPLTVQYQSLITGSNKTPYDLDNQMTVLAYIDRHDGVISLLEGLLCLRNTSINTPIMYSGGRLLLSIESENVRRVVQRN